MQHFVSERDPWGISESEPVTSGIPHKNTHTELLSHEGLNVIDALHQYGNSRIVI